jgi:hypothetical protein
MKEILMQQQGLIYDDLKSCLFLLIIKEIVCIMPFQIFVRIL